MTRPSESDNWFTTTPGITRPECHYLDNIDELRREQPILHLLLAGTKTSRNMAKLLSQPHEHILLQLRTYKTDNLAYDIEGIRSIYWYFKQGVDEDLDDLQQWMTQQNQRGGYFNPVEDDEG